MSGPPATGYILNDGLNHQYLYDAEGRICAVASTIVAGITTYTGYLYDGVPVDRSSSTGWYADGTRIAKGTISSWSCDPALSGFQTTNDYVLGLGGEQLTEMGVNIANPASPVLTWQHANVWAGGKLLGTYDKDGLHFYFDDPLGTRRAQTDSAGVLEETCQSLPYGDALNCFNPTQPSNPAIPPYLVSLTAPTEHHFTGKERDIETGNDYFEARYYSSAMGRFMSPDWSAKEEPVPYAQLDDPQSLNLYAYVGNNPMTRFDVDGHEDKKVQKYVGVVIKDGKSYEGKLCGDHECVAYVKEAGGFNTQTKDWKAGPNVLDFEDKGLQSGTAIMLADKDGHYPTQGARHAAEFMQFNKDKDGKVIGFKVREQWAERFDKKTGKKTREARTVWEHDLPIKNGKGNAQGDASQYHILMIPKPKEPK
jgi:RHS repeat-associated protein